MSRQFTQVQTTKQTKTAEESCRSDFTPTENTSETCVMDSFENHRISVHVMKALNTMRENGEFCDLIFELSNSKISAHRLVLAVWSSPVKSLLQVPSTSTQHLRVAYDKPEIFQIFINFLYTGVLQEQVTDIPAVLLLAATFQIDLLTEMCKEHLKASTTVNNVISIFHLTIKFKLPDLEIYCMDFLCQHLTEITQMQELRDLTPSQMSFFLGSEHMTKLEPEIKLCLIMSWLAEDVSSREQFLVLLLRHIDWSLVAKDFLKEIINTENLFTANPSSLYLLLQTLHSSSFSLGPYENHFWSLRHQYSYLLSSVVSSSVALCSGKPKHFQPLRFSLLSSPTEEQIVPNQKKDITKAMGIKNELLQFRDLNQSGTSICHENAGSDIKQVSSSLNIPVPTLDTSKNDNIKLSQFVISQSTDKSMSSEGTSIATTQSTAVEGSMRRKCLRPHKIVTDTNVTKNKILKLSANKINNNSKLHNTRGRTKGHTNVLHIVSNNKSSTDDLNTEDSTLMEAAAVRKENIQNKNTRKQLPAAVKVVNETSADNGNNEQHMNQRTDDLNLQRRKKIRRLTSIRTNRVASTISGLKNKINQVNLKKETRIKKDVKLLLLKCCDCEFTTYNRLVLEKHKKQVHEGNCLFCCSLCSFKSKWSKEYYDHLKQSHFPGPPFYCEEADCGYSTDKFQTLISHRKQHSDQRPFVCNICLTAFRSKNNLYQHFQIHSDEKKFACPECGRGFKLKNTLEQHLVTHSDLRPYLCDLCGFSTKFQSHLISHKRIHTGDVHRCNFASCAYSTPKKSQLKSHMRSHMGIRRHICSTCGKAFVEKSHLIRHERTHSSERAYVCKECSYSSTRADKLREHIQKHHSEEALRVKATTSASKKLESSGKSRAKKIPKASKSGVEALVSNPDSLIEVVVLKGTVKHARPSNDAIEEAILPSIPTASEITARLVQSLPFLPLVSQDGAAYSGVSLATAPTIRSIMRSELNRTAKNEKELTTVDTLTRSGIQLDTVFGYQVQTDTGNVPSASSLGDQIAGNKMAGKVINYLEHTQNTNLTVPPYNLAMVTSSQFDQTDFISQQSLQVSSDPSCVITLPNATSSTVTQQYYHSQHQHADQLQHQQIEQSAHFPNVESYLY